MANRSLSVIIGHPKQKITMPHLPASLHAWDTPAFAVALKCELEHLGGTAFPLQHAAATSSVALDNGIEIMFISARQQGRHILAKVGVFFSGIVAGCACADDPTPVQPQQEYGEFTVSIDMTTASADITLEAE